MPTPCPLHRLPFLSVLLALACAAVLPARAANVANWNFENNFSDSWGTYHGTGYNTPAFTPLGINGSRSMRVMRGYSEYVTVPDNAALRPSTFSLTAWARALGYQGNSRVLINKYNHATNTGYLVYVRGSDEKWIFKVGNGAGGHQIVGPAAVKGQWIHLAATFEQTGTYSASEVLGTMRLYVNGDLYDYDTNIRYAPNSGAVNLVLGADWTTASGYFNHFDGLLDDVRFHSHLITTAAVATLYTTSPVTVDVMTLNVAYGAYNYAPAPLNFDRKNQLIAVINAAFPDIVLFQECTDWADAGNTRLQEFAAGTGMPYTYISPHGDWWKVAIMSRFPLSNTKALPAGAAFWRNIAQARAAVTARRTFGVASQHFAWWGATGWDTMTLAQKTTSYANQKAYLLGAGWLGAYLNSDYVVGGDWNHSGTDAPYGQGVFHNDINAMGFGLDKLRTYQPGANPIDTFYTGSSTRLQTLDCYELPLQYSDHEPVVLRLLVKH